MADFMIRDRPQELWFQIDQLHLSYLQTEEIPEKIDQRKKLEGIIWEYLSLVPHDRKFHFRETANVLHRSASTKEDFSGYRAASAWNAIGLYASNLLSHPWRKEYRELELYCGFYKHEIEANLVGAEVMLEQMGYKHTSRMTMVLEWPMDPDQVSYVSRDSLVAFVECQLMMRIWEEVSSHAPCTWLEVLEYRELHVGSCEHAVRGLLCRFHQRHSDQHQHQQYSTYNHNLGMDMYGTGRFQPSSTSCMYGQVPSIPHLSYCGYTPYMTPAHSYTLPLHSRYTPSLSSPTISPSVPYALPAPTHPPYHPQSIIKPQDLYPTNGHHPLHQYPNTSTIAQQPVPIQNGYSNIHSQNVLPQSQIPNYSCSVPTGQLIELEVAAPPQSSSSDTQQVSSATDSSSSVLPSHLYRPQTLRKTGAEKQREQSLDQPLPRKVKDDGTGTFDSWDYVYRNLESQGYNKDLGERPDILSPPTHSKPLPTLHSNLQENKNGTHHKAPSIDLEEALMEMRLDEYNRKATPNQLEHRAMKFNEALQQMRLQGDGEPTHIGSSRRKGEILEGADSVYDNMSSPPKESPVIIVQSKPSLINQSNKATTKTLPRDLSHYSSGNGKSKREPSTSHTLDSRKSLDRTKCQQNADMENECFEQSRQAPSTFQDEGLIRESCATEQESKWQCITCTYLNPPLVDICEMCDKSKTRGPEVRPLASGGRECPQCTLVNEKGVGTCEACGTSLKDSPTYI